MASERAARAASVSEIESALAVHGTLYSIRYEGPVHASRSCRYVRSASRPPRPITAAGHVPLRAPLCRECLRDEDVNECEGGAMNAGCAEGADE